MKQFTIFTIIISLGLSSCSFVHSDKNDKQVVLRFYQDYRSRENDTINLIRSEINDSSYFIYKFNDDTLVYSFHKSIMNDSLIDIFSHNCPLVSEKTIKVDNQSFRILKYYYDIEGSYDEETSFFYHKDYGLLVGFNDGWLDLIFSMEYDRISKILIDSIISDRTGFYLWYVPPPPPPDSLTIEK